MTSVCDVCGYEAKNAQGLAGHKQFKHQLAGRYEQARELAGSVELLEDQQTQLKQTIPTLKRDAEEAEGQKAELQQEVADLKWERAELEADVSELRQRSDALVVELAQKARSHLLAAGWIPPGADATVLGVAAFVKWASGKR
jgi:chromosome segregation ATPase